jgi:hypothetical protein
MFVYTFLISDEDVLMFPQHLCFLGLSPYIIGGAWENKWAKMMVIMQCIIKNNTEIFYMVHTYIIKTLPS